MHYSAQTISASTSDTTPSLLLNFDGGAKYLFNCGEGTQRALSQLKVGTKGLKSIFATELGSDAVGGLSGPSLCLPPKCLRARQLTKAPWSKA